MTAPCMLGFKCPYKKVERDGDTFCSKQDVLIEALEAQDCPLVKPDSEIERVLMGWKE